MIKYPCPRIIIELCCAEDRNRTKTTRLGVTLRRNGTFLFFVFTMRKYRETREASTFYAKLAPNKTILVGKNSRAINSESNH